MLTLCIIIVAILIALCVILRLSGTLRKLSDFAQAIAQGNLRFKNTITEAGDVGLVVSSLEKIPATLSTISDTYKELANKITEGYALERADVSRFQGEFAQIVRGTNSIMEEFCGALEAIPSVVIVLDKDARMTYLNIAGRSLVGEDYMG